jgi:excisionase family DNA binding protein
METIQFVTVEEAAEMLRVHPYTVRRLVWRRRLPAVRVGRSLRVPLSAIRDLERRANEAVRPRA